MARLYFEHWQRRRHRKECESILKIVDWRRICFIIKDYVIMGNDIMMALEVAIISTHHNQE